LSVRVRAARDLASFAVGTGDDEYLSRETKDQIRIEEYEQQMMAGEKRIRELNHQIANLEALQGHSRQIFPSPENRS
jgi:predicted  nucleic acid-binding Zn-ribbon protein